METFLKVLFYAEYDAKKKFQISLTVSRYCGSKFEPLKQQNDKNT